MVNGRQKGKRREREIAAFINDSGYLFGEVVRAASVSGGTQYGPDLLETYDGQHYTPFVGGGWVVEVKALGKNAEPKMKSWVGQARLQSIKLAERRDEEWRLHGDRPPWALIVAEDYVKTGDYKVYFETPGGVTFMSLYAWCCLMLEHSIDIEDLVNPQQ